MFLDDPATWPAGLADLLDRRRDELAGFEAERASIDSRSRDDVSLRIRRPDNPFQRNRDELLADVNSRIADSQLVGWHCTRLHEEEVACVERDGLFPLSRDLLHRRIEARVVAGDLSAEIAGRLRSVHQADDENRRAMIWFLFTRGALQDEGGLVRLFKSWGGEALYNSHERDSQTGPALSNIGIPCIVEAAVPVRGITTFMTVGERLLNWYLAQHGISTGHGAEMEGYVVDPVPGGAVQRVLRRSDPEFEALTGCRIWEERI